MRHPPWWFFVIVLTAIWTILIAARMGWLPVKGDEPLREIVSNGIDQAYAIGYEAGWNDGYGECFSETETTVKGDRLGRVVNGYDPPGDSGE